MFKKNEVDAAMKDALRRADEVLAERGRIQEAITKTSEEMKSTETELGRELDALAVEEADLALAEGAGERETAVQRRVQKLRLRLEAQQARVRGLHKKLIEQEDRILEAQDAVAIARDAWIRARSEEFITDFRRAAAAFAAVLRKGVAIGDAIGNNSISAAMREARAVDPVDLMCPMFDMEPTRPHPANGMNMPYPAWEDDPAAVSAHEALVEVRLKAEKLDGIGNQFRKRREEEAREEARRRAEAEHRTRSVAYEYHYPPEYSPVAAVEVIEAGRK